jgi:signal transduction histidine kinase
VALRRVGDTLEFEIADDGRGIPEGRREQALSEGHIGLASVHERVRSVNGNFTVESSPEGTRTHARLPLADVLAAG